VARVSSEDADFTVRSAQADFDDDCWVVKAFRLLVELIRREEYPRCYESTLNIRLLASMTQPTSLPVWIEVARSLLDEYGFDAGKVFSELGIVESEIHSGEDDRYSVEAIAKLWRKVAELTGNPSIGIEAAESYFQPAHWQALGLSLLCSSSLFEAFQRLVRYSAILSDVAILSVNESDERVEVVVSLLEAPEFVGDEAFDFGLAASMKLFRMVYPQILGLQLVELTRQPVNEQAYIDAFGCDVVFAAERVCFSISSEVAHKQLPMSNEALAAYQDRLSEDYKQRFGNNSFAAKVKDEMLRQLPGGEPTPKGIAESLCVSVRNLQRKLKSEGTSFSIQLSEIRQQFAKEYLAQQHRSCTEVAYMLGFSDSSNFNRAFRRWFDQTPTQYRESLAEK